MKSTLALVLAAVRTAIPLGRKSGKKRQAKNILAAISSLLLCGCATMVSLAPLPENGQQLVYEAGDPTLISEGKHIVAAQLVTRSLYNTERAQFLLFILNRGTDNFVFSEENIDARTESQALKVYSHSELEQEAKKAAAWRGLAVALSGIAQSSQAAQAGYQYQYGTVNTYQYGTYGGYNYSGYGTGTYSGYSYNPALAAQAEAAARAQTEQELNQVKQSLTETLDTLGRDYLKTQTVRAGQIYGGTVYIDVPQMPPDEQVITLKISTHDDTHVFKFDLKKAEQ